MSASRHGAQLGDYATVGQKLISLVDTDSFWIDGSFEETSLGRTRDGDPATVKLMDYSQLVRGHVGGVARGIKIPNAQPDSAGLASVNPIFTWVRLAQRVPVRIHVDRVGPTTAYISSVGLPLAPLGWAIAIAFEVGGGLLLILGFRVREVASGLAVFTLAAAISFHHDFADRNQMIHFSHEHHDHWRSFANRPFRRGTLQSGRTKVARSKKGRRRHRLECRYRPP